MSNSLRGRTSQRAWVLTHLPFTRPGDCRQACGATAQGRRCQAWRCVLLAGCWFGGVALSSVQSSATWPTTRARAQGGDH